MKTNPREILLYYNSKSQSDKKTLVYARTMSKHVKVFDYNDAPSSSTSWAMVIMSLGRDPKTLLNKAHPDYQSNFRGKEFDTFDWINIIQNNPHLMKSPIAVRGGKAIVVATPTDILRL
jgi:arsenate reductase